MTHPVRVRSGARCSAAFFLPLSFLFYLRPGALPTPSDHDWREGGRASASQLLVVPTQLRYKH